MRSIVVDTGPLVALFKRRDRDHARVKRFLRENSCSLITTWPVVTGVWHMLGEPARLPFARWIVAGGVSVFDLRMEDQAVLLGLLEKYRDRPMDVADASLVLLSDRMGLEEIFTIDRSDFDVYRLKNGKRFVQVLAMAGL